MRKPFALLAAVDAEPLEATVQVACERARMAFLVAEDEHADGPRLAVAHGLELDRPGGCRGSAELFFDRRHLVARA